MVQKTNLSVLVSTGSWAEQFSEALQVSAGKSFNVDKREQCRHAHNLTPALGLNVLIVDCDSTVIIYFLGDDEDDEDVEPGLMDYVMHYLTLPWKVIISFLLNL